jgi:hypothetical protein
LERPVRDKHASLLRTFVNYSRKKFYNIGTSEGGWGWVILFCSFISLSLAQGLQWGFSFPIGANVRKRFVVQQNNSNDVTGSGDRSSVGTFEIGKFLSIDI